MTLPTLYLAARDDEMALDAILVGVPSISTEEQAIETARERNWNVYLVAVQADTSSAAATSTATASSTATSTTTP